MSKQIFDSEKQFLEVLHACREEKQNGADGVGVFGSRGRGDHELGKSDVDLMVRKEGVSNWGEYSFRKENIQIVRTPLEVTGDEPNDQALKEMQSTTRWI